MIEYFTICTYIRGRLIVDDCRYQYYIDIDSDKVCIPFFGGAPDFVVISAIF